MPVTVKCRIGIDDQDPEEALEALAAGGRGGGRRRADRARAQGLARGPLAAREPRRSAARLRSRLPAQGARIRISRSCSTAASRPRAGARHLDRVDGVMMGRAAYQEPWRLLGGRSAAVRRRRRRSPPREGARRGADPLYRARARARRAAPLHHPPRARPVPRRAGRARVPPPSRDRSRQARRGRAVLRDALALVLDTRSELAQTAAA